jgi:hypothetical protein
VCIYGQKTHNQEIVGSNPDTAEETINMSHPANGMVDFKDSCLMKYSFIAKDEMKFVS